MYVSLAVLMFTLCVDRVGTAVFGDNAATFYMTLLTGVVVLVTVHAAQSHVDRDALFQYIVYSAVATVVLSLGMKVVPFTTHRRKDTNRDGVRELHGRKFAARRQCSAARYRPAQRERRPPSEKDHLRKTRWGMPPVLTTWTSVTRD